MEMTVVGIFLLGPTIMVMISLLLPLVPLLVPGEVFSAKTRYHKWRACYIRRVNNLIIGLWAIWIIIESPQLWVPNDGLMGFKSRSATLSLLFYLGYHVAETVDMILNQHHSLIVHHLLTILIIIEALYRDTEMGFVVWLLAGQGQNVFLITRLLQIIEGVDKFSTKYRITSYINIVTFFFTKIVLYGWMTSLFITETSLVITSSFLFLFVNPTNIYKFIIILKKDIFSQTPESPDTRPEEKILEEETAYNKYKILCKSEVLTKDKKH